MKAFHDIFDTGRGLTSQDLIDHEHTLKDAIAEYLSFTSYSLFFPQSLPESLRRKGCKPEYRAQDHELILPLTLSTDHDQEPLGYFVARGVRLSAPKALPPFLAALARAQLEKILLYKQAVSDPLTGLSNRDHFLTRLTREIELIQTGLHSQPAAALPGEEAPAFAGQLGVIVLDLDRFQWINDRYGYLAGDDMAAEVGRLLKLISPKHVTTARLINDRFAVLLPDAGPRACFQLAELIRASIEKLSFDDPVTGDHITITASLGTVSYPQSLSGPQLMRRPVEQARMLLRQANKAVYTAKYHGRNRIFAFADILRRGGRIIETLPMNRLAVSLGRSVGARPGQRFLVRTQGKEVSVQLHEEERITGAAPAVFRGEVVLIDVQEEMSFAEILHLADPSQAPAPGDGLNLTTESDSPFENGEGETSEEAAVRPSSVTGLYGYGDFVHLWAEQRAGQEAFCLALVKVLEEPRERSGTFQQYMDARVATVRELVQQALGDSCADITGGRFGLAGALFFASGMGAQEVVDKLQKAAATARKKHGFEMAVGAAQYPYLSFTRAEVLDMSRKALDHALLLPEPRLAAFDSISLNISADKRSSEGDLYGAVEEYKLSLLADETNTLARNSLGVSLAQLGRFEEACREFERVAAAEPDNLMARYNLGWALLRLGNPAKARKAFEQVLDLDANHVFARIRLAGLAEAAKKPDQAWRYYEEASRLPGGEPLAVRHLARLAVQRGETETAREYLHLALKANHNDAMAMHLLSKLYLDSGEDPQIAEVLARQASALSPEKVDYWDTLERALREQGKDEEADKVAGRKRVV